MTYEKYTGREAFVSLAEEPYLHIAPKAFLSCKTIESLKLPMTLESIGDWAFAHMHILTDLYLPARDITLGKKVFLDCENLQRIHIMDDTSGNEGLSQMLGAAVTILKNTDLLRPHLAGHRDTHEAWLADFDEALKEFLVSEDGNGFEPVFYGWFNDDDVYSTQLPLYLKKKRTGKLTLAFMRLRYPLHLADDLKALLQTYLADHMPWGAKAGKHTITWDFLPSCCQSELIYIQILEQAGAFETAHIPALIEHLQDASAEVIAYLLNLHTANKCADDFFTHFSL
ncbi:MAG: leucine-rich repeat protein [Lachnospiraceae bacterium]|nr:leucine-rich repeat protein [Lachnospiraceae bacterium]